MSALAITGGNAFNQTDQSVITTCLWQGGSTSSNNTNLTRGTTSLNLARGTTSSIWQGVPLVLITWIWQGVPLVPITIWQGAPPVNNWWHDRPLHQFLIISPQWINQHAGVQCYTRTLWTYINPATGQHPNYQRLLVNDTTQVVSCSSK